VGTGDALGPVVTTSHTPLQVNCAADDGGKGTAGAPSSLPPMTPAGGVTGGVVGGAGVGAAFGAPALAFIPVLGVIVVLTGVAVGASTGQAVESAQRPIGYPELISIPMSCRIAGESAAAAPAAGALLGMGIRGLPPGQARDAGLGERNAVLVTAVSVGSRADAAGLRSGDIILAAASDAMTRA
jgi:hypothetical protein